jgi:hypothetical protein
MRALQCGRQSVLVVAALVGAGLVVSAADASAAAPADPGPPALMPIGAVSLSPSLDRLGLLAPRFSLTAIGGSAATPDEWYNRLTLAQPQGSIAAVFETRFAGLLGEAASSRTGAAAKQGRVRSAAVSGAVQPGGANISGKQPTADSVQLAYADPSPTAANDALSAISAMIPGKDGVVADIYTDLPLAVPLPAVRPEDGLVEEPEPEVQQPIRRGKDRQEKLALVKPDMPVAKPDKPVEEKPGGGLGNALRNLFGGARAGNGVAIYDISAAKVYMPDGSVLEAHSGVGKMADDPRYVHVKMNGPTPPHTYNLKMRERRFHGVEAIRMLPVDGKNKHGRDGFLTHSYLLRGRAGQSHGCVAFKDYDKFLKAFKSGKVKQLVVVTGGGRAVARAAQKGRDS